MGYLIVVYSKPQEAGSESLEGLFRVLLERRQGNAKNGRDLFSAELGLSIRISLQEGGYPPPIGHNGCHVCYPRGHAPLGVRGSARGEYRHLEPSDQGTDHLHNYPPAYDSHYCWADCRVVLLLTEEGSPPCVHEGPV